MPHLRDCIFGETLHQGVDTFVQRATHTPSGAAWVVKMTLAGTNSPRAMGRLVHEERMLVKLASVPGVVRLVGIEHDGLQVALILEDQRLESLDRVLAVQGRLSLRDVLHVGLETSRVLDHVHAAGVVHKDVKPQNILWDEKNHRVTLLDFAIASELAEEATTAAIPEALEGTLAYMSPEQTGRMARGIDARTDLYSLGIVLFELFCGHRPFVETDPLALVHAHLAKPVPELERLVPQLPPVVVHIVERCLEKHPEKRYQTARGLAADLTVCIDQLDVFGRIDDFVLGQKDYSPVLHLPQRLLSRENEVAQIQAAFERTARGSVEVLLLRGPSGVGKTALMRAVYEEIAKAGRGLLLSGKHDELGRSVPYAALARAFGGLFRDVAASSKPVFDAWRSRIDAALGPLARIIVEIVPELEWLMGEIPPLPVVPPEMTYNRVKLGWIEFVRVIADTSPPLVLFLDDVQWVDPASLEILKVILTDIAQKNLLVIAAYRDNEVNTAHPLWTLIEPLEKVGLAISRLSVGPLDEKSVREWLGVALAAEARQVASLARVLHAKTHGNPFFLGQLLLELHRQKFVHRDAETGAWVWDQEAVEQAAITDNVVELMQRKVVELPLDTQTLLGRAACAGHEFSLSELSVLSGYAMSFVARDLHPALLAGLVVPLDGHYREAHALSTSSSTVEATYRFLHDRVQQAFYERIDPARRTQTHLLLGRRLQKAFDRDGGSNQKFLELVRHLNLGAAALTTEADRKDLARLDLQAAKAAKANGSYRLQASLVEQAQALLGAHAWQDERDVGFGAPDAAGDLKPQMSNLSIDLALERIEADYMLREFGEVHRRVEELLALPLSKVARLTAQSLRMQCFEISAQFAEGEIFGLDVLIENGQTVPDSNEACTMQFFVLLMECQTWLDEHPEGFSRMPLEPSVEHQLLDLVAASVMNCLAFGSRTALAGVLTTRNVLRILERGTLTPVSPYFISSNASLRSIILGRFREDVCWTREGLAAAQRLASPYLAQCMYLDAFYIPHRAPMGRFRDTLKDVIRTGLAVGSFQGTSWGLMGEVYLMDLWPGRPLAFVAEQIANREESMLRYGDIMGQHGLALMKSVVEFLRTPRNAQPPQAGPWLEAHSALFAAQRDSYMAELARIEEAHLYVAFGEYARALERAEEAEAHRTEAFAANLIADIPLWRGLARAKLVSPDLELGKRRETLADIEMHLSRLRYSAEGCPENFGHKVFLLEAEQARVMRKHDEAAAKYDAAIDDARKEGFLYIEGLAAHFCAQFYLEQGRVRIAELYLREAHAAYIRWDAQALVAHLELRYPGLLKSDIQVVHSARPALIATLSSATETSSGVTLDVHTVIRAAQALAGELDHERVMGRLMELCLENAGAERGALVALDADTPVLVARLSAREGRIETGLSIPLASCTDVATTVIHYVARSRASVVVHDVSSEKLFADDPYMMTHKVRSLLALPMTHGGRLGGVLYFEHGQLPAAFPPSRVEMLSVLASQAAIALENAKLVRNIAAQVRALEGRNQEVQELNDELRRQIAQRSRRLMESLLEKDDVVASTGVLALGSELGDCYCVLRRLGEGAMGTVYEVERTTDGKHLAAKVLNHSPDRHELGRFMREAQILASLSHPNLISIYDVDVTDTGVLYIVMEFVAGKNLRQIQGHVGDVPWVLNVLRQVASALEVLHGSAIVHRDLKPENILVVVSDDEGFGAKGAEGDPKPPMFKQRMPVVKLADFGISIVNDMQSLPWNSVALAETLSANSSRGRAPVDRDETLTQTGVLVGTPLYMAPELAHGSKKAPVSSDIFSFGVIAYELLAGDRPYAFPPVLGGFVYDDVRERLRKHVGLSANVVDLITRCLEAQPEKRPGAGEVVVGLGHER